MTEPTVPLPLPVGDGNPRVAVVFDDTATTAEVRAATAVGMDIAEVRVDRFVEPADPGDGARLVHVLDRFAEVPTVATIRSAAEGGGWDRSEEDRLELYRAALGHVGTVDVEIGSSIAAAVTEVAHRADRAVIGSFHDFERTPDRAALDATVAAGDDLGVDVVKVATMVHSPADVRTLAGFLVKHHDRGLIVVGMGPAGAATRVLFPFLGSRLTFATAGVTSAPGQLPLEQMVATLRDLSPQYAARHPAR